MRDAGTEIHTGYHENILTDLLLSSEIRGYIAHPMQYFGTDDRSNRMKLDLLMMVQGWAPLQLAGDGGGISFSCGTLC